MRKKCVDCTHFFASYATCKLTKEFVTAEMSCMYPENFRRRWDYGV